jgi:hypothetical protein
LKPITSYDALTILCEDCGRTKVWNRLQIDRAASRGAQTIEQLGKRARCIECKLMGGEGENVLIRPGAHPSPAATTL